MDLCRRQSELTESSRGRGPGNRQTTSRLAETVTQARVVTTNKLLGQSRLGCFVPHQSEAAVFTHIQYVQVDRAKRGVGWGEGGGSLSFRSNISGVKTTLDPRDLRLNKTKWRCVAGSIHYAPSQRAKAPNRMREHARRPPLKHTLRPSPADSAHSRLH